MIFNKHYISNHPDVFQRIVQLINIDVEQFLPELKQFFEEPN